MSKDTGKQAKDDRAAEKAADKQRQAELKAEAKAAAETKKAELAARGKKLDANGREIVSPKNAINAWDRANADRDTPAKDAKAKANRDLSNGTQIAGLYKSSRTGNEAGDAEVRSKSVLGGRFTRQEVHVADEKGELKRVEKLQTNALRTRQVSYGADGAKTAAATYKGGVQVTKHTDKDGNSQVIGVKVGNMFERRYGFDADGNKVKVASRTGLSSSNTVYDADGGSLTKDKQLGGLRSTTTAKDADGNEQVVAKRRGTYRSSTYQNEDGTSTTIKGRKGLYSKTSEQSLQKNEDGSYKIVETTKTSRFGGLYKKTSSREVDLSDTQKKSLGAKQLADSGEAAAGSAKALHKAVKDIREGKEGAPNAKQLLASVQDFAGKSQQYRDARVANGDQNVPKTKTLMKQFAAGAERDDRLRGVNATDAKKQLEDKAVGYIYAKEAYKGGRADKSVSAGAYGNFREAAVDYAHVMQRDGLAKGPQSIGAIQKDVFGKAKAANEASLQKAMDNRSRSGREQKMAGESEANYSKAKEADHFKDFVSNIDVGKMNALSGRTAARARDANVQPAATLTKENLAKLTAEKGDASQQKNAPSKAPSVRSDSGDSFFSAKSGVAKSDMIDSPAKPKEQAQRPALAERGREAAGRAG